MLKLALIGLGNIAQYQIAAIRQVKEIEIVAGYDINSHRSSILPNSVRFYENLDSLINNCDADIFLVATPNETHFDIGMNILQKDRGLLIEKPCSTNLADLNAFKQMVENSGQFCAIALHASYALDLMWFITQINSGRLNYGRIGGFFSGFYDPYYKNGEIIPSAIGLGGSWLDSGINALSTIARIIDIGTARVVEGRMTVVSGLNCSEIQGAATINYFDCGYFGKGIIDTNWALGINRKKTHLYYVEENIEVTMDHSNEIVTISQGKNIVLEKNLQNNFPRLVNHYVNLFRDIVQMYHRGKGNFDTAYYLHQMMLEAHKFILV